MPSSPSTAAGPPSEIKEESDQYEAESERLIGLGAAPVHEIKKQTARWTTFIDPEGNEFDLVAAQPAVTEPGEYAPSPSERVRDQVARYEATGGAGGGELGGLPVVILTSYAGNPRNPQWYYNLLAHPEAQLQDGALVRQVRARELSGAEKQQWWGAADALNPNYARYRAGAGQDIPVLTLEPAE